MAFAGIYVIITSRNTAQIRDLVCFGEHCYIKFAEVKRLNAAILWRSPEFM